MSRGLSLAILVLAVLAVMAGLRFTQSGGNANAGCSGVRDVYERVSFIQASHDVPTTKVYSDASLAIRKVAVGAPAGVAPDLNHLADAYNQLAGLLRGFDPKVPSTYHISEDNTTAIEAQQAAIETGLPNVKTWLDSRCK
jgi:hypothetical protein